MRMNSAKALLDIPDLPEEAFKHVGDRKIRPQGDSGGGGSSQPANTTSTTTQTTELPEWARGYAKEALAKGQALTDVNQNPYQQYTAPRIAGFSPMQQQAMQNAQGMSVAPQIGEATAASTMAGLGGLNVAGQANPYGFQNQVGGYMNPYINQILAPQLAEANRNYDISGTRQQSAATQAGAFGGSREAIMAAENERNRNMGLNQIYGQGLNTAYTNAQNQYNQNLQNQLAGYGMANQAAGQLGQLGQNQYQQNMGINQLQAQYGGQQQALAQQGLTQSYQDFINQQNYPYKQLGFMSDLIRGLPLGQQSTASVYQPPGSISGQIAGLGLGALGISQLGKMFAEGGDVHSYADGGEVQGYAGRGPSLVKNLSDPEYLQNFVHKYPATPEGEQALMAELQRAQSEGNENLVAAIESELGMRRTLRSGLGSAVTPQMVENLEPTANGANGGIVAFAGNESSLARDPDEDKKEEKKEEKKGVSSLAYLAALAPTIKELALPAASAGATGAKTLAQGIGAAARGLGTVAGHTGAAYAAPVVSGPVLGGGLLASQVAANQLENYTPEQLEQLEGFGADPSGTSFAAAITRQAKQNEAKKTEKPAPLAMGDKYDRNTATRREDYETAPKLKVSPTIFEGITKMSQQYGVKADALMDQFNKMRETLNADSRADMDILKELASQNAGRSQALKDQAVGKAMAEYGFTWAQRASRPGARFLGSASEASPSILSSLSKSQELIHAAEDADQRIKIAVKQSELAMRQGNRQLAAQWAQHAEQLALERLKMQQTAGLSAALLKQKGEQFNQLMGVRSQQAAAQGLSAQARMFGELQKAQKNWAEGESRNTERDLVNRYGKNWKDNPVAVGIYNQKKQEYIRGEAIRSADATPASAFFSGDEDSAYLKMIQGD